MSGTKRYMHECRSDGCWSFCVTTDRDPAPWTCPTCEDLALEEHVRFMEARQLSRSPRHTNNTHKESLAS
jgi:hypothetical protein